MTDAGIISRYQAYRTERFLINEQKWSGKLQGWRTQRRRRILVLAVAGTLAFAFAVSVVCAFGVGWAPLLWIVATVAFIPSWTMLQIASGRQGDAPTGTLDEWEVQQRNSARSIGLTVTQGLAFVPACYLIFGAVITRGVDENMSYAGGLMVLATLLVGGCTPAMILGWTRPDPDFDESELA
ncbi:hypothetical protein [Antrihabitans cavernicola]|uniref:Uncharacterized protein n=1 Tax=Antrihabitans cavernicola TaxID=2495913 RepID=A0A5A7S6R1_9NOCA|nr:hypothetical protein [Spelaeibacter cavernicola]KAA0021184.1 hypothetical protein FOY51_19930 [Spelaeibacter cavernicola]